MACIRAETLDDDEIAMGEKLGEHATVNCRGVGIIDLRDINFGEVVSTRRRRWSR
jgi:hypothetical protein